MSSAAQWHYVKGKGSVGPLSIEGLVLALQTEGKETLIYGPGLSAWTPAHQVADVSARVAGVPPLPPVKCDEIDYEISGHEQQYVTLTLDPGEKAIAEAGAMMYLTAGIKMDTHFGSAHGGGDLMAQAMTAGKRLLTGESLFIASYQNVGNQKEKVAFAAPFPGTLLPLKLADYGGQVLCQKDSFLCGARGIEIDVSLTKNVAAGLVGGEGFILQKIVGDGLAILHAGGALLHRSLQKGEKLRIDTGCLVAMTPNVNYDVEMAGDFKNAIFGGEGLFFATLEGPGDVWLQSLPFSRLARRVLQGAMGRGREEGSVLGPLGTLLRGDNLF